MESLPPFVLAERDAIVARVYEAFEGVSREGGVSWSESVEIDNYRPPEQEQAARQSAARAGDLDTSWTQLVDDPDWYGETGIGGWNFLDATGFRYYLPAQMVRCLLEKGEFGYESLISFLTLRGGDLPSYKLDAFLILSLPQQRCVKRFIRCMDIVDGRGSDWKDALDGYWKDVPDE